MTEASFLLSQIGETRELVSLGIVDSLADDNRVNLTFGDDILPDVPCLKSYTGRAAGDHVLVINFRAGRLVIGAIDH